MKTILLITAILLTSFFELSAQDAVCVKVVRREITAEAPYASPRIIQEEGSGILAAGRIITDNGLVRGLVSAEYRATDSREWKPLKMVAHGFDAGLALFEPEMKIQAEPEKQPAKEEPKKEELKKDEPKKEDTKDDKKKDERQATIDVKPESTGMVRETRLPDLDSELKVIGCSSDGAEIRRVKLEKIHRARLENSDGVSFRILSSAGPVPKKMNGAPVFQEKQWMGILHRGERTYVLPPSHVMRFLDDVADGFYTGIATRTFKYQTLSRADLRKYLSLPESLGGVRITQAEQDSGLFPGDYLLSLNGKQIDREGLISQDSRKISIEEYYSFAIAGKWPATVNRAGKEIAISVDTTPPRSLGRELNHSPDRPLFYTTGLIFQELDYDLLHDTRANNQVELRYYYQNPRPGKPELVLTHVFADPLNSGSDMYRYAVLDTVNGEKVTDLRKLREDWKSFKNRYFVLTFKNRAGALVIPREEISAAEKRIREKYPIPEAWSVMP